MVQLFDSQASYPSSSIVAYHNGLWQCLSFSSPVAAPLRSPWVYLGTDVLGVPTPEAQLVHAGSTTSQGPSIFDEAEELSMAAEDAFQLNDDSSDGDWRHISRPASSTIDAPSPSSVIAPSFIPRPSSPQEGSHAESHLQSSSHVLNAELVGEFVFKSSNRGVFAFAGGEDETVERTKETAFRDILGDDRRGGEDAEKRETWLESARARTEYYGLPGAEGPDVQWILVTPGQDFPENALPIGSESTSSPSTKILYAARAYHDFSVQLGKAGTHLGSPRHSFTTSPSPGREAFFHRNTFEVLCTSPSPSSSTPTKWITVSSHMLGEEVKELLRGERPVEGGRERDGSWLGVGRGILKGGEHPGKVRFGSNQISIGWGGKETLVSGYQLLVYA